jgi:hypothetical protein
VTSILSSISGYFSKALILGTFLPVVIFILLSFLFLMPLLPSDLSLSLRFQGIDKEWKVLAASFGAVVITGLIYNLNIPILRLYEGYPWRYSWIGMWLTRRHIARFDAAQNRIDAMRACRSLMEAAAKDLTSQEKFVKEFFEDLKALGASLRGPRFKEYKWLEIWSTAMPEHRPRHTQEQWENIKDNVIDEYSAYRREVKNNYPDQRSLILPTRLGNVIRSFEYYPRREYQIDSIALWPRLIGIIPKDYAVAVDDAKTSFDFMMNCSALSVLLSVSMLLAGLISPARPTSVMPILEWLIMISVFGLLSYFFYLLSINRVGAWGALVKGAFDLYRWELLKKLGYKQEPQSREEERKLWGEISRQMIYGDRYDKSLQGYAQQAGTSHPIVRSSPRAAKLEITKGVKVNSDNDVVTFCLRVKNTSPNLAATDIILTDKLADDFEYEWESAKIGNDSVPVLGTNPYEFKIGSLLRTAEVVLSYNGIPRKKDLNR